MEYRRRRCLREGGGSDEVTLDNADFKVPLGNIGTCRHVEPEDLVKGWR